MHRHKRGKKSLAISGLIINKNTGQKLNKAITVACVLKETDSSRKTGRTLIWGSHRPLHRVTNVKSSVANDETGFKVLTLKDLSESSKVKLWKHEIKFKEYREI
jgi:hypothetical protein